MMSYWTFSDVFEEQGVVKQPFYGGFGLIAAGGIPKPSYNAFKLLHLLGDERITLDSSTVLATRHKDGSLVVAVWNLIPPDETGQSRTIHLRFEHLAGHPRAYISQVDRDHGDIHPAYEKMGQPRYPTEKQLAELQRAAKLPPAEIRKLVHGELTLDLPPDGLSVVEVK
jgi:xylan 1,4-beta-xylosidase